VGLQRAVLVDADVEESCINEHFIKGLASASLLYLRLGMDTIRSIDAASGEVRSKVSRNRGCIVFGDDGCCRDGLMSLPRVLAACRLDAEQEVA
jgi:hypothetical protein